MSESDPPTQPSLPWRVASVAVMGTIGALSRGFMNGFNNLEVTGLEGLLGVLDRRKHEGRERGLLTVCNHVAVLDDPLIWGMLPIRYFLDAVNMRWGLGAHDICFKNKATSTFFSLGQVLPTHRLWYSPYGGLYQPTMTQAIRLLSGPSPASWSTASGSPLSATPASTQPPPVPHPLIFSTNGLDQFQAPAAFTSYRNAWVHVFPEACCHQSPDSGLRYFKWGVSRLILESDPAPEFIPMFVHGTQHIMAEDRGWPRWAPRMGKTVRIVIGEPTDVDQVFGHQRAAWRKLVAKGDPELLRDSPEAAELRISVAKRVRDEVEKLRESLGFPAEHDGAPALAETWAREPRETKFTSPVDGSLNNRHGPKQHPKA